MATGCHQWYVESLPLFMSHPQAHKNTRRGRNKWICALKYYLADICTYGPDKPAAPRGYTIIPWDKGKNQQTSREAGPSRKRYSV